MRGAVSDMRWNEVVHFFALRAQARPLSQQGR